MASDTPKAFVSQAGALQKLITCQEWRVVARDARLADALQWSRRDSRLLTRRPPPGKVPFRRRSSPNVARREKREPATRSVEKSFPLAFPTGHGQTEQAKKGSKTHI